MDANLFGNYPKLLHVEVMGRQMEMPDRNTLLRGLQFAAPDTISYGRFCWNGSCNNCIVTVRNGSSESEGHACSMDACDGMRVTTISGEIRRLL